MKIGVLTSSRADFGIYYPLIERIKENVSFELEIIAFGTHLDEKYGYTIDEIIQKGFNVKHEIITSTKNDSPKDISKSVASTIEKFSEFWNKYSFDLVLALGDRYEMFAAVTAASTFNIDIAHIHAGETTLGAIDNAYRHSISHMSKYLFVSNDHYRDRAIEIIGRKDRVFNVGALSIDNLSNLKLYSKNQFYKKYNINLDLPTILSTFHPETVSIDKNREYIFYLIESFKQLKEKYQIVITMPNSDTLGDMIRAELFKFGEKNNNVHLIESFGIKGYLSCMKYCSFLLGNTSSGFVEASYFPKWVINLGNRQEGRLLTKNIINIDISIDNIIDAVDSIKNKSEPLFEKGVYGDGNASLNIINRIKGLYGID